MIEVRTASDSEIAVWCADWQQRLRRWYGSFGVSSAWVADQVRRRTAIPDAASRETYVLLDDGVFVGFLTVRVAPYGPATIAGIVDVCVASAHRRRGIGTAARKWAEQWARSRKQPLLVVTNPADEASLALFSEYPLVFQTMMKPLPTVATVPGGIESRPMTGFEFVALRDAAIRGFAASTVRSGLLSPSDAMKRSVTQFGELPVDALATENSSFLRLYAGSDPVAGIWLVHHSEPNTSFVCHVEVDEAHRGRGYGGAAMAVAEQASINAGDANLGLSVFGHNKVAINLYAGMGYEVVEQGRSNAAAKLSRY